MSGHSRLSGDLSQHLDTRRSQTRGIVDEPQNCRLKVRIIEAETEREPSGHRVRKKKQEGETPTMKTGEPRGSRV